MAHLYRLHWWCVQIICGIESLRSVRWQDHICLFGMRVFLDLALTDNVHFDQIILFMKIGLLFLFGYHVIYYQSILLYLELIAIMIC